MLDLQRERDLQLCSFGDSCTIMCVQAWAFSGLNKPGTA